MTLLIAILLLEHGGWISLIYPMDPKDLIILAGVAILWVVHLVWGFVPEILG